MCRTKLIAKFVAFVALGVCVLTTLALDSASAQSKEADGTKTTEETKDTNQKKEGSDGTGFRQALSIDKGDNEAPLFVKSNTLSLDAKARVFTYRGDVEITREDMRITADVVIGKYDKNNKIQRIICEDNVVITKGTGLRASSDRAVYNVPAATIVLTEGPELFDRGNVLSADKVTVFIDEDRSEAEGEVRVKVVKTDELPAVVNQKGKTLTEEEKDSRQTKREDRVFQ